MEDITKDTNTPDNSVPRAATDVPAGEGGGNESDVKSLAEVVNQEWGTNFKDDASALQGLRDNASMRGKFGKYRPIIEQLERTKGGENQAIQFMEDITKPTESKPEVSQPAQNFPTDNFVSKEQYEKDIYFSKHPELSNYQDILDPLKKANPSKTWDEVAQLPALQTLLTKAKEADDFKNSREPLTSSQRVYSNPEQSFEQDMEQAKKHPEKIAEVLIKHGKVAIPKGLDEQ